VTACDPASADSGDLDAAVATNTAGEVGVVFGGYTGFSPDECVSPAEGALDAF
jgi:hypothetical protein